MGIKNGRPFEIQGCPIFLNFKGQYWHIKNLKFQQLFYYKFGLIGHHYYLGNTLITMPMVGIPIYPFAHYFYLNKGQNKLIPYPPALYM